MVKALGGIYMYKRFLQEYTDDTVLQYMYTAQLIIICHPTRYKFDTQDLNIQKTSLLRVLLKQYRSPTDPNKFKSATIILVHFCIGKESPENKFWTKGNNSWKSGSTVTKVKLDL